MSSRVDIEALAALVAKATPGPWRAFPEDENQNAAIGSTQVAGSPWVTEGSDGPSFANAAAIVAMRNGIDALLSELREARKVVDAVCELDGDDCVMCAGGFKASDFVHEPECAYVLAVKLRGEGAGA